MLAIETDGDHPAGPTSRPRPTKRALELGAVTGQSAGHVYGGGKAGAKAGGQRRAVDEQTVAEHEHVAKIGRGEPGASVTGGLVTRGGVHHGDGSARTLGMGKFHAEHGQSVVAHGAAEDFAGRAATGDDGAGKAVQQFRERAR
jgi:hypothetical protein